MAQGRILIISLGSLKEAIYTLPLASVLRQNDYDVEYLISEKGFEIVNHNPLINRVHLAPIEQWLNKIPYWGIFDDISECVKKILKREFDIAIDCQRTFRSLPLLLKCGAKRRLSYSNATEFSFLGANEFIDSQKEYKDTNVHQVVLNLNFAKYLGLVTDRPEFMLPEPKYSSKLKVDKLMSFDEERPLIILSPNLVNGEFSWHPKNWVNLVANIPQKYNVVIVGNVQDSVLANKMSHKNFVNLCGKLNFEDLRYVISLADVILSNNDETSAIAWAMNKNKILTISTNLSPMKCNPYNMVGENNYKNLIGTLSCQPCNKKYCEQKTYKCSHLPTVETVLNSLY